jgi:hypothetical protein
MNITDFINSLGNYMDISGRITAKRGSKIDVGEEFTLRITIRNLGRNWYPFINFRNVAIFVNRGQHARPLEGEGGRRNLDTYLRPGETGSIDVRMIATNELSFWDDIWNAEEIASVSAIGSLDYERFFQVSNREKINIDF